MNPAKYLLITILSLLLSAQANATSNIEALPTMTDEEKIVMREALAEKRKQVSATGTTAIKDFYVGMSRKDIEDVIIAEAGYRAAGDRCMAPPQTIGLPNGNTITLGVEYDVICSLSFYSMAGTEVNVEMYLFNDKLWYAFFSAETSLQPAFTLKYGKPNKNRIWDFDDAEVSSSVFGLQLFSKSGLSELKLRRENLAKQNAADL